MITPLVASYTSAVNANDLFLGDSKYNTRNNKLILIVHMYTPYNFALNADMNYTKFIDSLREELFEDFSIKKKKYTANYHWRNGNNK